MENNTHNYNDSIIYKKDTKAIFQSTHFTRTPAVYTYFIQSKLYCNCFTWRCCCLRKVAYAHTRRWWFMAKVLDLLKFALVNYFVSCFFFFELSCCCCLFLYFCLSLFCCYCIFFCLWYFRCIHLVLLMLHYRGYVRRHHDMLSHTHTCE